VSERARERERERERERDKLSISFAQFVGFPPSAAVLFTQVPEGCLFLVQHFSWLLDGILT